MDKEALFQLSTYQFDLPKEQIAQYPVTPRDHSRLLVIDRHTGKMEDRTFHEIADILNPQDRLIFNNTKVIPARLNGKRASGGNSEIFLLKREEDGSWKALAKPGRKLPEGSVVIFGEDLRCEILRTLSDGSKQIRFSHEGPFEPLLAKYGVIPLPQYIRRDPESEVDKERYQTIYAKEPGAVAAPTAGLHFTDELFKNLEIRGIEKTYLTLHVGLGTFKPVQVEDIRNHQMHSERVVLTSDTVSTLNKKESSGRRICVGTTCCRALESAATDQGVLVPGDFETDIFMYPGYRFKYVDALLTNFHLPGSTLLMLVSAFAGYDLMMEAYRKAVKDGYRFFSYGDAMLIL